MAKVRFTFTTPTQRFLAGAEISPEMLVGGLPFDRCVEMGLIESNTVAAEAASPTKKPKSTKAL